MKTQNILISLALALLLVFSACREVTVSTKVNPDGTFTRVITVTGDSASVFRTDLPFPVDDTWARTSSKDTSDSTKYIVIYTKAFRNSDRLNEEIKGDTSKYKNLEKEIFVTKKFRFFFSYITFKEVYKSVNPFNHLDYRKYLTEDEIGWYSGTKVPVTPADSLHQNEVEDKVIAFLMESAITEVDSIIREGIKKLNDPRLNSLDLSVYHDSLYKTLDHLDFNEGPDLISRYVRWSGNDAFSLLKNQMPPLFGDFDRKLAKLETIVKLEGYSEEVEMPGLITATNSVMLKGNRVGWEFHFDPLLIRDYELYAESRVINRWAFILAGCVLLALVVVLTVKAVRR